MLSVAPPDRFVVRRSIQLSYGRGLRGRVLSGSRRRGQAAAVQRLCRKRHRPYVLLRRAPHALARRRLREPRDRGAGVGEPFDNPISIASASVCAPYQFRARDPPAPLQPRSCRCASRAGSQARPGSVRPRMDRFRPRTHHAQCLRKPRCRPTPLLRPAPRQRPHHPPPPPLISSAV